MLERRLRRGKNEEMVFHLSTSGSREWIKREFAFESLNTLTVCTLRLIYWTRKYVCILRYTRRCETRDYFQSAIKTVNEMFCFLVIRVMLKRLFINAPVQI